MSKRFREIQADVRAKRQKRQIMGPKASFVAKVASVMRAKEEAKDILVNSGNLVGFTDGSGNVELLSSVAAGTDATNRIGRKITYKSLQMNMSFTLPAGGAVSASGAFRWAIVLDRQANGVSPVWLDIFAPSFSGNAPALSLKSSQLNQERFLVLRTECFNLTAGDESGAVHSLYLDLSKILRRGDQHQTFNTTAAGIAAINQGAIYLVYAGCSPGFGMTQNGVGAGTASLAYCSKIRFTDA